MQVCNDKQVSKSADNSFRSPELFLSNKRRIYKLFCYSFKVFFLILYASTLFDIPVCITFVCYWAVLGYEGTFIFKWQVSCVDYYFAILAMMFLASTFFFEERVKFLAIFPVLAKRLIYSALYSPFFSALGISPHISQIWKVPAGYEGVFI